MNSKQKMIIGVLAFVLIMMIAYIAYNKLSAGYFPDDKIPEASPETEMASDFEVLSSDGRYVRLSDFRGRGVVVNLWATWCPPCRKELPSFEHMYKKYGGDVEFMMVDLTDGQRETAEGAKSFIEQNGYSFPVYFDTGVQAAYLYATGGIPVTLFIDSEGRLVHRHSGMMSEAILELYIEKIL